MNDDFTDQMPSNTGKGGNDFFDSDVFVQWFEDDDE